MTDKGQHLDLSSGDNRDASRDAADSGSGGKFLGVHFACCDVYSRVYPNREQTAYVGHCPRCAKRVQFRVGTEGTNARFFQAF